MLELLLLVSFRELMEELNPIIKEALERRPEVSAVQFGENSVLYIIYCMYVYNQRTHACCFCRI